MHLNFAFVFSKIIRFEHNIIIILIREIMQNYARQKQKKKIKDK